MVQIDDMLLALITFLPIGTALALLAMKAVAAVLHLPALPASVWRVVALAGSSLSFALALKAVADFDPVSTHFQFTQFAPWWPGYGIDHFFGIDGISLFLVVATTLLVPVVLIASWNEIGARLEGFVIALLCLETGMLGVFVSLNLLEFYIFWELTLIPLLFLVGIWGGRGRVRAAVEYVLFTLFGSLFMLVAIVTLYWLAYEQTGRLTLDLVSPPGSTLPGLLDVTIPLLGETVWWKSQTCLFAAFALAFAIRAAVFPFHSWLPGVVVAAPSAGSAIVAGIALELGAYGFLRLALPIVPSAAVEHAPTLIALALVGIVFGWLVATVQRDLKALVAYSCVAQMGFVLLGIFVFNVEGLVGAVLQMINHAITATALVLLIGFLEERRDTREISDYGGIAKVMPVHAAFLGIVVFASIGLPLLNGFVGVILILVGAFLESPPAAIAASLGIVLSAVCLLGMFGRVAFGPLEHPENRSLIDLSRREKALLTLLVVPIFWIGIYPEPFLRRIEPSAIELLRQVDVRRPVVERSDSGGEPAPGAQSLRDHGFAP